MKKIVFIIIALCSTMATWAQNELLTAVLHHEGQARCFTGSNAFVLAEAAAVDGDVITLSSGTFLAATITKSISVYGAGFENDPTTSRVPTRFPSIFTVKSADGETLSNVHLEGILFQSDFTLDSPAEGFVMEKCYIGNHLRLSAESTNTILSNCVIRVNIEAPGNKPANNCLIKNCHITGKINAFPNYDVTIDHCIALDLLGHYNFTNCILTYCDRSDIQNPKSPFYYTSGAKITNCVLRHNENLDLNTFTDCYIIPLENNNIFVDGQSEYYRPEATFEILQPETWIGTDGKEIGIRPGWSKVPSSLEIIGVTTSVSGDKLNIEYQK